MTQRGVATVNKRDICLYALVDVGGDVEFVPTEDVAVRAFELFPERFGLVKHTQYPDVESVHDALWDLQKEKYGSLVEGNHKSGWRATKKGARWEARHRKNFKMALEAKLTGERRVSSRRTITSDKIRSSRLSRIINSEAFAKWKRGERLTVYDFYELLRIDNYTPETVYREHLRALLEVVPKDGEEKRFLRTLARRFGGSYRDDV